MPTKVSEEEIYHLIEKKVELARKRLGKRAFYTHVAIYSFVNIVLVLIWRETGAGFPWFALPLGIWGIFILFHFLMAFVFAGRGPHARDWVRTVIEKEVERLKEVGITAEEIEKLREADTLNKGGN